jgi:hypothetical protein
MRDDRVNAGLNATLDTERTTPGIEGIIKLDVAHQAP